MRTPANLSQETQDLLEIIFTAPVESVSEALRGFWLRSLREFGDEILVMSELELDNHNSARFKTAFEVITEMLPVETDWRDSVKTNG